MKSISITYVIEHQALCAEKSTPSREVEMAQMSMLSKVELWLSVDPLAEKYLGWSPYNYTLLNPINFTDPTGMNAEWHYNDNGYLVSDAGGDAQTLSKFKDISLSKAQNIIQTSNLEYRTIGIGLKGNQVVSNRAYGSPYILGQNFNFTKTTTSWNIPGLDGGKSLNSMHGTLNLHARVTASQGDFYLNVSSSAGMNNNPSNKINSYLSIKYSNDKSLRLATKSYRLKPTKTLIFPPNTTYVGSKTIPLPKHPSMISRLSLQTSISRINPGGGGISVTIKKYLLPYITF